MRICLKKVSTPRYLSVQAGGGAGRGVARVALEQRVPCTLGILTTETMEQAVDRAGGKHGNKGADAAVAAIEMASLIRSVRGEAAPLDRATPAAD